MTKTRDVPCGSCRLCCQSGEVIVLHPEDGDVPALYQTESILHPLKGYPVFALKRQPDGSCIYLGPSGCTIYSYRPVICREFDCRELVKRLKAKPQLGQMLKKAGGENNPVVEKGIELLEKR